MKNNRQEIIDWIINNDELVRDIIKKTNDQISGVDPMFREEALSQQLDEVSRRLSDEIGKSLALTFEELNATMDKATLRKVMEML